MNRLRAGRERRESESEYVKQPCPISISSSAGRSDKARPDEFKKQNEVCVSLPIESFFNDGVSIKNGSKWSTHNLEGDDVHERKHLDFNYAQLRKISRQTERRLLPERTNRLLTSLDLVGTSLRAPATYFLFCCVPQHDSTRSD